MSGADTMKYARNRGAEREIKHKEKGVGSVGKTEARRDLSSIRHSLPFLPKWRGWGGGEVEERPFIQSD